MIEKIFYFSEILRDLKPLQNILCYLWGATIEQWVSSPLTWETLSYLLQFLGILEKDELQNLVPYPCSTLIFVKIHF